MADCMAVSLVRYAERIGYRCNAFFGIRHPDNDLFECRAIWTQTQRQMVADNLAQAQSLLEDELRYPLCPRWITDERHPYAPVLMADWTHIIAGGVQSSTVIQAGAAVTHTSDPATVTINGVTCDVDDIHVYHAGTDDEIFPSAMTLVAGALTITIPWCRLVAPAYQDNPETGWDYNDHATWIAATVDVYCVTNDPSTQAHLISPDGCTCTATPCADTEYDGCIHLRLPEIGSLDVTRGTYAGGVWTRVDSCHCSRWVELNYQAGLLTLPRAAEDAIIRLAHSLMAEEPCGCDVTQRMWRRDRAEPPVLDRERLNCPWGTNAGAWFAWQWAQANKMRRGSVL